MIVQFFNHGTGRADSAIRYLLSDKDSNGNDRNPKPEIFSGDKDLTKILIDNNSRKFKYTSGVIAFRDNEKPKESDLKKIIKSFYETFAPGLGPERLNMLIVRHEDKGNTELHLLVPMVDVKTQKHFNIDPPGKYSKQLIKDFAAIWNHNLGYAQVVEDPLKSEFSNFDKKVPAGKTNKSIKTRFSIEVPKLIRSGKINNRDDFIMFLEEKGHSVTRKGNDFISVKFKGDTRAIRFKGPVFSKNSDYPKLIQQADDTLNNTYLNDFQLSKIKIRLEESIKYRKDFINKRLNKPRRFPKGSNAYAGKRSSRLTELDINSSPIKQLQNTVADKLSQPIENISKLRRTGSQNATNSPSTKVMSSGATTGIRASLASVQANIISAISDLSNAKTPEEKASLERRLSELRAQEAKLQYELEEAKKTELNHANPIRRPKFK